MRGLLVRGARGLIYFSHLFKPTLVEAGLLADPEMVAAVGAINKQVQDLAPILNSPTVPEGAKVVSSSPVEVLVKRREAATYVFAVGIRGEPTTATLMVAGLTGRATADVLGENRSVQVQDGAFKDEFAGWDVHLYRIRGDGKK